MYRCLSEINWIRHPFLTDVKCPLYAKSSWTQPQILMVFIYILLVNPSCGTVWGKLSKQYWCLPFLCEETEAQNCLLKVKLLLLLSRFSHVRLCATPQMAAHQAPPSLGFSRQEHWSGLPFPSPMQESEKWKWSRSVVSESEVRMC